MQSDISAITFFVDMDGVLVDFAKGVCDLFGKPQPTADDSGKSVSEYLGISVGQMWARVDERGAQFWVDLDPTPFANGLVSLVKSYGNIFVASSPSISPYCAAGKILWLQSRFGRRFRDFAITPKKHHLAGPNAILVDDNKKNCDEFQQFGGRAILVPTYENNTFRSGMDILEELDSMITTALGDNHA